MNKVVLYCRPGFEKECAAEITERAAQLEVYGFARVKEQSGYVVFECYQHDDADQLIYKLPIQSLIFVRQFFVAGELLKDLPNEDRITPIVGMLTGAVERAGDLRVEVPDTNSGRELIKFCRKLTVPLRQALRQSKLLLPYEKGSQPVIHVFFIASGCCYVGYSYGINNSSLFMGVPRLKLPVDAPDRSTLKLEEAFHTFIPYDEWEERLTSGMYAVDLGAPPGGWTYQLVKRSMMVMAVGPGVMAPELMESGQVTHYPQECFQFTPNRKDISWVVCDRVNNPMKVSQLMATWLINGWAREAIFNLKLPTSKRYEVVKQVLESLNNQLEQAEVSALIQAKQLYHDRDEITVHVRRIWSALPGRLDERERRR